VLERFESDKKHKQDSYTLILVETTGEVSLKKVAKSPATRARVERAIRSVVEGCLDEEI
jgi:3-dehydroquinate synthetase